MRRRNFFVTDITEQETCDDFVNFWQEQHTTRGWLGSVGCVELCPTTGRMHAHITYRAKTSTTLSGEKGYFMKTRGIAFSGGVEFRQGSWNDALDYILRRGSHENKEGELLATWSLGEGPKQGERTDQTSATDMLAEGERLSTVLTEVSGAYRYVHALEKTAAYVQAEHRDVEIRPVNGSVEFIKHLQEEYGDDFIYVRHKFKAYDGQRVVFFRAKNEDHLCEIVEELRFDQYVKVDSGVVPARWVLVFVSC